MLKFSSVILLTTFVLTNAQSPCSAPNGANGRCIALRECDSLFQLLQKRPLLTADRQFLANSQCGYQNNSPYVCCAGDSIAPTRGSSFSENDLPRPGRCGIQAADRIIGGTETKINEFPWAILIEYSKPNNRRGFHCGGVLINENYVVTASHCINGVGVVNARYRPVSVRLGEWDLTTDQDCEGELCSNPPLDIPFTEVFTHENYVPSSAAQENDIALIRLSRPVNFTDYIRPICLPVQSHLRNKVFDGVTMAVSGWGKTETASKSNRKLKVSVDGVPIDECNRVYRTLSVNIGPKQLCAGGKQGLDSCNGDSGGPIMTIDRTGAFHFHYLTGLVSFGPKQCGSDGWPGVYTRVSTYIDWIVSKMRP